MDPSNDPHHYPSHLVGSNPFTGACTAAQTRGRGRPPKRRRGPGRARKPQVETQLKVAESNDLQVRNPPGRPRKNEAPANIQAQAIAPKRRGRPRKLESVSAGATVFPFAANVGSRRGRPNRAHSGAAGKGGASMVEEPPSLPKRRGRPPKIGGAVSKPMKPVNRTGRPVGRPRKDTLFGRREAPRQEVDDNKELKRKYELLVAEYGELRETFELLKGKVEKLCRKLE